MHNIMENMAYTELIDCLTACDGFSVVLKAGQKAALRYRITVHIEHRCMLPCPCSHCVLPDVISVLILSLIIISVIVQY